VQEYRQICVNINRIKIAMEMGRRVVLCNLDNLYESLYDALNQVQVVLVSDTEGVGFSGGGRGSCVKKLGVWVTGVCAEIVLLSEMNSAEKKSDFYCPVQNPRILTSMV
jgi:hypothetical protein